jgi:hypothetical protein
MAETACPICQSWFVPLSSRHRYCSSACRRTAWERAHTNPPTGPTHAAALAGEPGDVYACALCHRRRLGPGTCDHCGTWLTRIGLGGACPHCAEPVAIRDLLEEVMSPEA